MDEAGIERTYTELNNAAIDLDQADHVSLIMRTCVILCRVCMYVGVHVFAYR
jgi:hypothetical protein